MITKFLDLLLDRTKKGTIKWIPVSKDRSTGFMSMGNAGNFMVDQLIEFNGKQLEVILQVSDTISLVISSDTLAPSTAITENARVVLPEHRQSKMNDIIVQLYDSIIELQVDERLFGATVNSKKSISLNS